MHSGTSPSTEYCNTVLHKSQEFILTLVALTWKLVRHMHCVFEAHLNTLLATHDAVLPAFYDSCSHSCAGLKVPSGQIGSA
jgi:hypothetical protein